MIDFFCIIAGHVFGGAGAVTVTTTNSPSSSKMPDPAEPQDNPLGESAVTRPVAADKNSLMQKPTAGKTIVTILCIYFIF